jgi:DNA-binding MarR family transcriptional regulator
MPADHPATGLDLDEFAIVIEDFNSVYIRLPAAGQLSFTTLSVLHSLSRSGPLRLSELTATEQVTQSAISQLVTRLEAEGLVGRQADPADGRGVLVRITDAGQAIVATRHLERVQRLAAFAGQLSPAERAALTAAMPALAHITEIGKRADR